MKVNIRRGVFETNSSSSHALVLSNAGPDDSKAEIEKAIHDGLLNVGWSYVESEVVMNTFMDKLAYLTELRICVYCDRDRDDGFDYKVSDVMDSEELRKWENEVLARLAERGIRCDGFRYDSLVEAMNDTWGGLDHQVVEDGCDSVGENFIVDEQHWVRKGRYGLLERCNSDDAGAFKEWISVVKCIEPSKSDIDVLFDDDIAIRYGWDDDDIYSDNEDEIPYSFDDVVEEAKKNRNSRNS